MSVMKTTQPQLV